MLEILYASDSELSQDRLRAFHEDVVRIFGEVTATRPEQLRMTVQRVAAVDAAEDSR